MKKLLTALVIIISIANSFAQGGFSTVAAYYSPVQLTGDAGSYSFNQFGILYTRSQGLSQNVPIYVEFGSIFDYTKACDENLSHYGMTLPLFISYRISLGSNGTTFLTPYTGPMFRFKFGESYSITVPYDERYPYYPTATSRNFFNPFQFGWQLGLSFSAKAFYMSVGYNYDFTNFINTDVQNRLQGFRFGLGVVF